MVDFIMDCLRMLLVGFVADRYALRNRRPTATPVPVREADVYGNFYVSPLFQV